MCLFLLLGMTRRFHSSTRHTHVPKMLISDGYGRREMRLWATLDLYGRVLVFHHAPVIGCLFTNGRSGAIPPLAEFQAQLWVLALLQKLPHKLVKEEHYRLHIAEDRRIQYGVDHENYAYQLAIDMEAAPTASHMLTRGPKMFMIWALGANFNTKFRLIGPWAFKEAEDIMNNELWETITRRGSFLCMFSAFFSADCGMLANLGTFQRL